MFFFLLFVSIINKQFMSISCKQNENKDSLNNQIDNKLLDLGMQGRFTMLVTAYWMKILETIQRQLFSNFQSSFGHNNQTMIKQDTFNELSTQDRLVSPKQKDNQGYQFIINKYQRLLDLLLYNQQQKRCKTMVDISIFQNQHQIVDIFLSKFIDILEQSKKSANPEYSQKSINLKIQKIQKQYYPSPNNNESRQQSFTKKAKIQQQNKRSTDDIQKKDLQHIQYKNQQSWADKCEQSQQFQQKSSQTGNKNQLNQQNIRHTQKSNQDSYSAIKNLYIFYPDPSNTDSQQFKKSSQQSDSKRQEHIFDLSQVIQSSDQQNSINKTMFIDDRIQLAEIEYSNIDISPHNCIGLITAQNQQGQQFIIGSGFLISSNLILTAANNLIVCNDNQMQQLIPISFNLKMIADNDKTQKTIKIKSYRMAQYFVIWKKRINDYLKQKNSSSNKKLDKQILKMKKQQLKYDLAIMKLQEPILKANYFELIVCSSIYYDVNVCGFTQIDNNISQINQKTHIQIPKQSFNGCFHYRVENILCGSPIFFIDKNKLNLVGIHISYTSKDNFNTGVKMNDKINVIIKYMMLEIQSSLVIESQKNLIYVPKAQYQEIQPLPNSNSFLISRFEKIKAEKQQLFKDKQQQGRIIQQMKKRIKFLESQTNQKIKNKKTDSSQQLQIESSLTQKNGYNYCKNDILQKQIVQIQGHRYNEVAKMLKQVQNKTEVTSLIIKNTVKYNIYSVISDKYRRNNIFNKSKLYKIQQYLQINIVQQILHSDGTFYAMKMYLKTNAVYFMKDLVIFQRYIQKQAEQIPIILSEFTQLRHLTLNFKHSLKNSEIFNQLVTRINEMKLQSIKVCVHLEYEKKSNYDWRTNLIGVDMKYEQRI